MTHFFGGLRAVHDFNLKIEPGEIKGLRWIVDKHTGKARSPLTTTGQKHTIDAIRYAISEHEVAEMRSGGVDYI